MNANYIYDIFETANAHNVDLIVGLDILRGKQVIPEGMTRDSINSFVGLHYDPLWRAYQTGNRKLFADVLAYCIEDRGHEADAMIRGYATGNEKLITDLEARFGGDCHV